MQTQQWKRLAGVVLAGVLGVVAGPAALGQSNDASETIEGTWLVQVTQQDCHSGAPLGAPFLSLLTFNSGGTMTETTSNPALAPAVRSPGHGVWQHTDAQHYQAKTMALLTLNGVLVRTQTITQSIEVQSDDTFRTTAAQVKFFRPDGSLLAAGCAVATGKRLELTETN